MKACILLGSPKAKSHTATLLEPFTRELGSLGVEITSISLFDKQIASCRACYRCQEIPNAYGCPIDDDMQEIAGEILASDILIFATPIYEWMCPAPMKAVMDRLFGLNKFYQKIPPSNCYTKIKNGKSLTSLKRVGLIATSGYPPEYAADLLDEVMRRYSKYSRWSYYGMYACQSGCVGDMSPFVKAEVIEGITQFARSFIDPL